MKASRALGVPGRWLLGLILLALWLAAPNSGFAQEDIDDLFTDPEAGVIEESEDTMDIEAITTDKTPRLSGSVTLDGGFVLGLSEWERPWDEPGALDFSPAYAVESLLRLDVRPASYLRFFGSLGVRSPYVDPEDAARMVVGFSPVFVEELFVDYTLAERLYFRVGKQEMTWGQGRLFNPGNFVAGAIDGISLKGFVPIGVNGLTAVAIGEGVLGNAAPDYTNVYELLALAGLFETRLSALTLGLSGYYRSAPGLRTGAYLKVPIGGIDTALEGVLNWEPDLRGVQSGTVLTSLFWEGGRSRWQIILEYLFDTAVAGYRGHSVGLGAVARSWLPKGWRPGVRWLHSFADSSGQVLLGIDGPVAPNLRLTVGLPLRYGAKEAYYRELVDDGLPDDGSLERLEERDLLGDPAAAVAVLLSLSFKF